MTTSESERLLNAAFESITRTRTVTDAGNIRLGVDLGTASIVLVALDENYPAACEIEYAKVIKDGLVVDYYGTMAIVKRLKQKLCERLGFDLTRAAIAVPPGTHPADAGTHRYVVEACGLEVTDIVDEPTAANEVLGVQDGVVVDIGGGTTGLTIFENGKAVYTADEPTGGTHISLVLMGGRHVSFDEAELLKRDPAMAREVMGQVKPVIQKMASIVRNHIKGYHVKSIWLVGGTCLLAGIEDIFTSELGVAAHVPVHPHLVTPLGIAMSCR